jgi:hypothetical protein
MISVILRNKKQWEAHKELLKGKVVPAPFKPIDCAPKKYPVLVVSAFQQSSGTWRAEIEFFYPDDFKAT